MNMNRSRSSLTAASISIGLMLALSIMAAPATLQVFAGQTKGAQESTSQTIIPMDPTRMFAYDNKIPMSVSETGSEKRGDVIIHDITFVGIQNRIKAYLVTPAGKGPFAGILFVHWLGDPNTTNRTEFLSEAVSLASEGTVCLLIDAMWAKPGWYDQRIPEEDYLNSIRQVVELRRAMDLLLDRPGVDPKRIAYVGYEFGAMYGAVMGSVDGRAKTYVLWQAFHTLSIGIFLPGNPSRRKPIASRSQSLIRLTT
jgi:hypothetical protein